MTKNQRQAVLLKTAGRCGYCGIDLAGKRWQVDHIKPLFRGDTNQPKDHSFANLMPACFRCNNRKQTHSIESFRSEIAAQVERVRRDSRGFKLAEDFGLVQEIKAPVVFYFEKIGLEVQP